MSGQTGLVTQNFFFRRWSGSHWQLWWSLSATYPADFHTFPSNRTPFLYQYRYSMMSGEEALPLVPGDSKKPFPFARNWFRMGPGIHFGPMTVQKSLILRTKSIIRENVFGFSCLFFLVWGMFVWGHESWAVTAILLSRGNRHGDKKLTLWGQQSWKKRKNEASLSSWTSQFGLLFMREKQILICVTHSCISYCEGSFLFHCEWTFSYLKSHCNLFSTNTFLMLSYPKLFIEQ